MSALYFPFPVSELSQYYSCKEEDFVADIFSYFEQSPITKEQHTEPVVPTVLGVEMPPQADDQSLFNTLPIAPKENLSVMPRFDPADLRSRKRCASNSFITPSPTVKHSPIPEPCTTTPEALHRNNSDDTLKTQLTTSHAAKEEEEPKELSENERSGEIEDNGKIKSDEAFVSDGDTVQTKAEGAPESPPIAASNEHTTCSNSKRRQRATPEQLAILEDVFITNPSPNQKKRLKISEQIGMSERSVQIWFQNRRAKEKMMKKRRHLIEEDLLRQQYYHAYYNSLAGFHPLPQSEYSHFYNPCNTVEATSGHVVNNVDPEYYYSRMSAPPIYTSPSSFH